jgi:Flp pilus assembly protein TadB
VSTDEPPDTEEESGLASYSDSKNVFGVEVSEVEPIGTILTVLAIPLTLIFSVSYITNRSLMSGIFAVVGIVAVVFLLHFRVSERRAMGFNQKMEDLAESETQKSDDSTKSVCRECHSEISSDVKRCPNCGWKPKKRGGLWWGTTALMSLNPIGLVMGAKGASDNYKASKGVSKEVQSADTDDTEEEIELPSESDPTDTLERLNELRNQGAITEAEYEAKKQELLDRI